MKNIFFILFSLNASCYAGESKDSFVYRYNISSSVTFDFTKSYSVDLGSITLLNTENRKKKFRYIRHSPLGYFFNKKTKKKKHLTLVVHNAGPEKLDSVFWAILGSGTTHYPVKPNSSTTLTAYLNLNFNPRPKEIIEYVLKNHEDLEYHIFSPMNFEHNQEKAPPPDVTIHSIEVIPAG